MGLHLRRGVPASAVTTATAASAGPPDATLTTHITACPALRARVRRREQILDAREVIWKHVSRDMGDGRSRVDDGTQLITSGVVSRVRRRDIQKFGGWGGAASGITRYIEIVSST